MQKFRNIEDSDGGKRIAFSPKTRDLIAGRTAFRCSFPGWGRITIGPMSNLYAFADTGILLWT